ncbi:MAG: BrnT family toxin [Elusimicrobiota bacterium]
MIPAKNVIGESRFLIIAKIAGKCFAAVFTRRGEGIRLISCHRADRRLERIYENKVRS